MARVRRVRKNRDVVGAEHAGLHARAGLRAEHTRCIDCGAVTNGSKTCPAHRDLPDLDRRE